MSSLTSRPLSVVLGWIALFFTLLFGAGCGRAGLDDVTLPGLETGTEDGGADSIVLPDVGPETLPPPPDGGALIAISVEPVAATLPVGSRTFLLARGLYADGTTADVTAIAIWTSNNFPVASAEPGGGVTAHAAGTARIRATVGAVFGEADIIVTGAEELTEVRLDPAFAELPIGGSQTFTLTAIYTGFKVVDVTTSGTWATDNPTVAKAGVGIVTGVSDGATTLRASFGGRTAFAKISVSGTRKLEAIEVSPFAPTIPIGSSIAMRATAVFTDGSLADVTATATWTSSNPGIVFVDAGGKASGVGAGTAIVNAFFGGFSGSTNVTVTTAKIVGLAISPDFATIAPGASATFKATATYSDGSTLDVTSSALWKSFDIDVANVGSGVVKGVSPGTTVISASFGGFTAEVKVTVSPAKLLSISITPENPTLPVGTKGSLKATGTYEGGSTRDITNDVAWSTDDAAIATISNGAGTKGQVTPAKAGKTTARARLDGIEGSTTLVVTGAGVVSIAVTASGSMVVGTKQFATARATYSDGTTADVTTTCTWSSDDTKVVTVSNGLGSQGQVTAVGAGSTSFRCTLSGTSGIAKVTVTGDSLASVNVAPIAPTCRVGDIVQFQANAISVAGASSNVTMAATWTSSNSAIVGSAGAPGRFRCNANGTATISATYGGKVGSTPVTVNSATITTIQVEPVAITLGVGAVQQYQAIALYSDGTSTNVTLAATWSSTTPSVASIGNFPANKGRATAIAAGKTTIQAQFGGLTGTTTLTVSSATITSISINPAAASVPGSVTFPYTATAIYSDGTSKDVTPEVTWASSNTASVQVSNAIGSKGVATTFSPGSSTITATLSGIAGKATLTVTSAKLTAVQVTPFKPSLPVGFGICMTATAVWSDGFTANVTGQTTWTSSNTSVASVSNALGSKGRVTPIAAGKANIQATYNGVTGSTEVTVSSATLSSIAITPSPTELVVGGSAQLTATGTFSDGTKLDVTDYVGWFSSDGSVADISNAADSKGIAFGFKAGTVTGTATRGAISGTVTMNVK